METIQNVLRRFGITRCYKGLPHTSYAIFLAVQDENCLTAITRKIYLASAKHFHCKQAAIERNIRTAVSRAWQINPELLRAVAGYPLDAAPTASEFIEIMATYVQKQTGGHIDFHEERVDAGK